MCQTFDVIRVVLNKLFGRKASRPSSRPENEQRPAQVSRCTPTQVPCADPSTFKIARSRHTRGCGRTTFQSNFVLACFLSAIHMLRIGWRFAGRQGADQPLVRGPPDRQTRRSKGFPPPVRAELLHLRRTYPRIMQNGAPARIHRSDFVLPTPHWDRTRSDVGSVMWSGCTSRASTHRSCPRFPKRLLPNLPPARPEHALSRPRASGSV
jgi:hypothetical protein